MSRLSRIVPRITLVIAVIVFIAMQSLCVYLFILNRRMGRELSGRSWREPTIIFSAAGGKTREVLRVYGVNWRVTPPVKLESLPSYISNAFIAAEDVRFRRHIGVDPIGVARALMTNVRAGGIAQGGSTINQQIIKARYLSQERTWRRKFVEAILAVVLDARLSKNDILELYLNDVYLGHYAGAPVLGVDEAARLYFGKVPERLRVDEAALIASIIRAPNRDNQGKRPEIVRARRDAVLRVMRDRGWINESQLADATRRSVAFAGGTLRNVPYPYYLRALRSEVVNTVGVKRIIEGRLSIVCEIDPAAQLAAERAARTVPAQLEAKYPWIRTQARREPLQVALLSVDPRTGGIRALVGGSNFQRSSFDRTSNMRRQPGSAFKTFAYLAAINSKRATTATLLLDRPVKIELSGDETWEPQNYDEQYRGRVTLRQSFEMSLNVPTVRLTQLIGLRRVISTARQFGFEERFAAIPALPLGVTEVTMRELTAAYTAFPNLGRRVEPYLLTEIRDGRGESLYRHKRKDKQVCDASTAYVMHSLLRGVVRRGTASRLKRYGLGYVAGKTGTTNDYRDAWFVGYTPDMVTSAWVGFDHGAPLRLSSAEAAIPMWGAYMSAIPHRTAEIAAPPGVTFRNIDPETGTVWHSGCPGPVQEVFLDGTAPTRSCPRGIIGRIVRKVFFDSENFDEPPAITAEKFRRWANEVDRNRQEVEGVFGRLRRFFGN
jgi:penicillin-binding protein 1B